MSLKRPPKIVLLGRTNAGKSTLFNRLSEHGKAIVSSTENTTRDQNRDFVYWKGSMFELIDTGGLDTAALDPLDKEIQDQVAKALLEANLILFVVDGKSDLMPQDKEVKKILAGIKKPVVLCINKTDNLKIKQNAKAEFSRLNIEPTVTISAINGIGTADLLDEILKLIPHYPAPEESEEDDLLHIALVGRPNVGKSSLFNALVGEDRVIVSDIAHTTRDINDTDLVYKDNKIRLIDTAGIRRKSKVGDWNMKGKKNKGLANIERLGVQATLANVEKSDVVILLLEAQKRISSQDKTLVSHSKKHGKGLIIVVNKWDLIPDKDSTTINEFQDYYSDNLEFAKHTPVLFISALNKQRTTKVLDMAIEVNDARSFMAPQEDLNDALREIQKRNPTQKTRVGRNQQRVPLVLKSLKQTEIDPPVFILKTPKPKEIAGAVFSLLEKEIRKRCNYDGVPIKIEARSKKK
ncbi:MAG: ribosome biogenesis GTPase Der [bacterium]|nr:ribosome biogenesis GTPase Der [bacterium]